MPALSRAEVSCLDPLTDPEWDSLLGKHQQTSFFHSAAWARVLHEAYGHRPFYFGRGIEGEIQQLLPVMEVASRWTGCRGVSLPFTDFCTPRAAGEPDVSQLYSEALSVGATRGWRYLECRGGISNWPGATPSISFYTHQVVLRGDANGLFESFAPSVRRAIRKAAGAVEVQFSRTLDAMKIFYSLHCKTRRRHGVPPQPFRFFEAISRHVLSRGAGFIATALVDRKPIASAVFFHSGNEGVYKFGASDLRYQQFRPNNLVMWEAIRKLAECGCTCLHLGRTSLKNEGLRRFKLGFGAREETIDYARFDLARNSFVRSVDRAEGWVNYFFRCLPMPFLRMAGSLLYPHLS